uniref:Single-stranded DNA-binding protein n=1 Tax=Prevotella sp. GTC17254 TaxID=3236794 RepID=A0AB33J3N7_9BACT
MNTKNNFTVTGYVCKDAEVKNFEKAAIARFGIIIKHTEHKGNETVTVSSILSLETWVKKNNTSVLELLKKGKEITVEGFFKPESYFKDGKNITVLKNIVTKVSAFDREKKQEVPDKKSKKA